MPAPFLKTAAGLFGLFQAQSKAVGLIVELDRVLSTLRILWMNARNAPDKEKWRWRIDQALDERMRLMRLRDFGSVVG